MTKTFKSIPFLLIGYGQKSGMCCGVTAGRGRGTCMTYDLFRFIARSIKMGSAPQARIVFRFSLEPLDGFSLVRLTNYGCYQVAYRSQLTWACKDRADRFLSRVLSPYAYDAFTERMSEVGARVYVRFEVA